MTYALVFIAGALFGYVIFERPQWSTDAITWAKSKLGWQG